MEMVYVTGKEHPRPFFGERVSVEKEKGEGRSGRGAEGAQNGSFSFGKG